jgi:hypothetical protein
MTPAFELIKDPQNRLILKRPGEEDAKDVNVRRAFPWSSPQEHISIRSSEGKELILIDDVRLLPEAQRKLVEEALSSGIFVPRIQRVLEVDVSFGHQEWHVITDRGDTRFRVQEREDIRFLPDGRFSIKDADGNVYEMPPLHQLDDASRRSVELLV